MESEGSLEVIRLAVKVEAVGDETHLDRVTLFLSDGGSLWCDVAELIERVAVGD